MELEPPISPHVMAVIDTGSFAKSRVTGGLYWSTYTAPDNSFLTFPPKIVVQHVIMRFFKKILCVCLSANFNL